MIYRIVSLALILTLIITCSSRDTKIPVINFNSILLNDIKGFSRTDRIKIYPADSLKSYINGAAEEYLQFGVSRVASCEYVKDNTNYLVDMFEFKNPLGAFGVYSKKRLPVDSFISLGTEALLGSSFIYLLKDRFFLTINPYSNNLPDFESLTNFASTIDSLIPGNTFYPDQIMVFPQKRLIGHSEKFWPKGLDNFAAPESCFSADYRRNNKTCTLFYSVNRDESEYETFKNIIQQQGRILTHTARVGKNSIYAVTERDGKILMGYSNRTIYGVVGVSGDYWAKALCEALFENLGLEL